MIKETDIKINSVQELDAGLYQVEYTCTYSGTAQGITVVELPEGFTDSDAKAAVLRLY